MVDEKIKNGIVHDGVVKDEPMGEPVVESEQALSKENFSMLLGNESFGDRLRTDALLALQRDVRDIRQDINLLKLALTRKD